MYNGQGVVLNEQDISRRSSLSLVDFVRFAWRHKLIICVCVLLFTAGAVVLALGLPSKYRSDIVFSPAESSGGGFGQLGGELGGLAAMAGINLGGGSKKSDEALQFLRSRAYTAEFIRRHDLMPLLFAGDWDAARRTWKKSAEDAPTISDGVNRFSSKIRQIGEDRRTGIVTMSIIWSDRKAAADWANAYIAEADAALRTRGVTELGRSVEYLKAEAARTPEIEVRQTISKVMETELKNSMMARTRDAYAFRVLDPAVPRDPRDRDSPKRSLIVAMGALGGLVFGLLFAVILRQRSFSRTG